MLIIRQVMQWSKRDVQPESISFYRALDLTTPHLHELEGRARHSVRAVAYLFVAWRHSRRAEDCAPNRFMENIWMQFLRNEPSCFEPFEWSAEHRLGKLD